MNRFELAAAAALTVLSALPLSAQQGRDFRWTGRVASGQEIEIRNLNGSIRAEPATGSEVEVVGRRFGADVDDVEIRTVRVGDGVIVCAVFPSNDSWGGRGRGKDGGDRAERRGNDGDDECSHGRRRVNKRNFDARVDFVVRVPAGVELVAATVSGDVEARGLRGPVIARSVSGDVSVQTSGRAEAASVSGNVNATLGRMDQDLSFTTVSGSVTVRIPAGTNADFSARTLSGRITSDFPIEIEGRNRERRRASWVDVRIGEQARGTFGRGGPELKVETVSGNIRVERTR